MQLDPGNPIVVANVGTLMQTLGRLDEAIALKKYASVRDPVNPVGHANLANAYMFAGLWDQAIDSYQTALRLSPDYIGAHSSIGTILLFQGDAEAALESFTAEGDEEYRVKGQAMALYALDRQEEHQAKLDELIERWGKQWPSEVAHAYAFIGDADRAFEWLNKSVQAGEEFEPAVHFLKSLASDPRWLPLLESIGQSPEQLDAIEFEVTLPGQK